MTALALSGCMRRTAPVAVAPQPTLDSIAYSGPAPVVDDVGQLVVQRLLGLGGLARVAPAQPHACVGHAVEQFCSFAEPADRHALRISVVSLEGELAFGLCSDPEAISKLDGLRGALADSIAELEGAV